VSSDGQLKQIIYAMNICLLAFKADYSSDSIILSVTGIILLIHAWIMKIGNDENARLHRLQSVESTILKQLEFHYNLRNRQTKELIAETYFIEVDNLGKLSKKLEVPGIEERYIMPDEMGVLNLTYPAERKSATSVLIGAMEKRMI
jgi:hypothetical protein